mgnify:CR=1 FL=1|jgi:hypothetical protein
MFLFYMVCGILGSDSGQPLLTSESDAYLVVECSNNGDGHNVRAILRRRHGSPEKVEVATKTRYDLHVRNGARFKPLNVSNYVCPECEND